MRIETDLACIERIARECSDANGAFRSFLKFGDLSPVAIDRTAHELYEEVSGRIDCTTCANCCKVARPVLGPSDVKRLVARLNLPARDFRDRYLKKNEDGAGWLFVSLPCPFLSDNRCTVYGDRPRECRSFPHLHKRDFTSRLIQVISNYSLCPIVFNVYESLKRELWRRR
jgi:Fe-S-cluster containining protein